MCPLSSHITRDMPRLMTQGENHPFVICEDFREVDGASEILEQTSSDSLDQMNEIQYLNQFHGISYPFSMGSRLHFSQRLLASTRFKTFQKPTLPNSIKKDGRTKGNCKEQSDGTVMVKSYLGVASLLQIGPTTATPSTVGPPQTWPSLRLIHSISPCGSCPTKIALLTAGFKIRGYHAKQIHPPWNLQILGVKSPKVLFPLLGSNSCNSLRALSMLRAF